MTKKLTPLLVIVSFIPLIITAMAVFLVLPDVIPTHADASGVDQYGSKYEAFWTGGLFTACCLFFAFSYHFAEALHARGVVHGTGPRGARLLMVIMIVVFVILSFCLTVFWLSPS